MNSVAAVACLSLLLISSARPEPTAQQKSAARELYERGTVHYRTGELDQAAAEFKASYEAYPLPETLFNLAQTQRLLRHYDKAIFYYRNYEATANLSEHDRETVEQRITEIQRLQQQQEHPATSPPAPTPTASPLVAAPTTAVSGRPRKRASTALVAGIS